MGNVSALLSEYRDYRIWAPAYEVNGHKHHNAVALAAKDISYSNLIPYLTYTGIGKSVSRNVVVPERWEHVQLKLQALACYTSQIALPDCRPHFLRSQEEYYE